MPDNVLYVEQRGDGQERQSLHRKIENKIMFLTMRAIKRRCITIPW